VVSSQNVEDKWTDKISNEEVQQCADGSRDLVQLLLPDKHGSSFTF